MLSFLRRLRKPTPTVPNAPADWPTVFHVTHYKAGSQWLHRILHYCAPDRIVTPQVHGAHLRSGPVRPGMIYPAVYCTGEAFAQLELPPHSRRFVVIRDLRDTLVSWYFSAMISHVIDQPGVELSRRELLARNQEDGLLWAIEQSTWFARCPQIQRSWLAAGVPLHRFEDLLERDTELIPRLLLEECGLPICRELVLNAVRDTRFERLSGGRPRGVEDVHNHYRKGIAGDWRNYFTDRVKRVFKARFGDLLVATEYERNLDW